MGNLLKTDLDKRSTSRQTGYRNEQKYIQFPNSRVSKELPEILFLTSYPPRECGIATYSEDLITALDQKFGGSFKLTICPLENTGNAHDYPAHIGQVLNTEVAVGYLALANEIDSDPNIKLVVIQHEFGLFSGNEKAFIGFLEMLDCPVVMTMHTVLPKPNKELRERVRHIVGLCEGVSVMTQSSADILYDEYGLLEADISVIPHGTHSVPYKDRKTLKEKYDLSGKSVLSTFGLLGPNKSIETTLDALPEIVAEHPETVFLILGKTHPELVKRKGEEYRHFLEGKVKALGLGENVRFVDRFLPLEELLDYLQLTDIYLFTSNDPEQAVSGTFAYAIGCGCPVISTPIPHAEEVLKNGAGRIFGFGNSVQLGQAILELMDDSNARENMRLNGLRSTAASAWDNSAIAHARFFGKHSKGPLELDYRPPSIKMDHLRNMTTDVGLIQFSKIDRPDIGSGYTVDDNARALIATCRHFVLTGDVVDLVYIRTYLDFIYRCIRFNGQFFNYVDRDRRFPEQDESENLEDAFGRAMWAMGYFLSMSDTLPVELTYVSERTRDLFGDCLERIDSINSPRAVAFIIKGLYYYTRSADPISVDAQLREMADKLVSAYGSNATDRWHWFEKYLTYANAVLPEALLMAYVRTLDGRYRHIAKESFDFLLSKTFSDGSIRVISNEGWLAMEDRFDGRFRGGEQPIDVAYTILALKIFHSIFPLEGYDRKMEQSFNWFMGDNPMNQTIYNTCTGGCYDGLEFDNVNLNQGAESTVCYLLARMAFEEMDGQSQNIQYDEMAKQK